MFIAYHINIQKKNFYFSENQKTKLNQNMFSR